MILNIRYRYGDFNKYVKPSVHRNQLSREYTN